MHSQVCDLKKCSYVHLVRYTAWRAVSAYQNFVSSRREGYHDLPGVSELTLPKFALQIAHWRPCRPLMAAGPWSA